MQDWLLENYNFLRFLHIVALISWMAGLLYLPRLFVYHADLERGSPASELFKIMERRLLRAIMTPAMIATFLFGGLLLYAQDFFTSPPAWIIWKLGLVFLLAGFHGFLGSCRRQFQIRKRRACAR